MRYALAYAALVACVSGHGVVTQIKGANGVTMPGLSSIRRRHPRDCSSNGCGSQADTSIIRDREMGTGRASPLGRTQGNGPVDASKMVAAFMGGGNNAPTNKGAESSVGQEDDLSGLKGIQQRRGETKRQLLGGLLGGGNGGGPLGGLLGGGGNANGGGNGGAGGALGGLLGGIGGGGGTKSNKPVENSVAASVGEGQSQGMPTASDDGKVTLTYRQINQDGAGPLTADIDATSGGTDASAFQRAQVTQNVPGAIAGLSLATNTDFPVEVQMPQGMTCEGTVAGVNNVCIVRVRNSTPAGPFGGSAAFTQSNAARKRAIAYRLKKRFEINRPTEEEFRAAEAAELEEEGDDEE
ncbi:cell surface protein [Purpureocillium lavendulum]|uniref:Cell surface protein n=1 Tax=Purpureocillium lavendulum TaxID=1247861 RepID=A0AB34G8Y1_9HYPO|nr:cell surface protein [Purpureocillium lavendulum]